MVKVHFADPSKDSRDAVDLANLGGLSNNTTI